MISKLQKLSTTIPSIGVALALLGQVEKTQAQAVDVLTDITITPTEVTFVARPVDEQTGQIYPLLGSNASVYDINGNTYPHSSYNVYDTGGVKVSKMIVITRPISGQIDALFSQLTGNDNGFPTGNATGIYRIEEIGGKIVISNPLLNQTSVSKWSTNNLLGPNGYINTIETTPEQVTCVDGKLRIDMNTNGNIGTGVIDSSGTIATRLPATIQLVDGSGNLLGSPIYITANDLDSNGAWLSDVLPEGTVVGGIRLISDNDRRQDISFSSSVTITGRSDIDTLAGTFVTVTNNLDNTTANFQTPQVVDTDEVDSVEITYRGETFFRRRNDPMPKSINTSSGAIAMGWNNGRFEITNLSRPLLGASDEAITVTLHGCNTMTFSSTVEARTTNTGTDQVEEEMQELSVYPNPASDFITIKGLEHQNFHYEMMSIDGRIVDYVVNHNGQIDVANLPQGIYIVQVTPTDGDTRPRVLKFVK